MRCNKQEEEKDSKSSSVAPEYAEDKGTHCPFVYIMERKSSNGGYQKTIALKLFH